MKLLFNKNTIRSISIVSCLVAFSMGGSSFASYATLTPLAFPVTATVSQADGQRSLAEFGQRLETRLAGVWQEIRGLVGGSGLSVQTFSSLGATPSLQQFTGTVNLDDHVQAVFSDVEHHPQAPFISLLAKKGVISGQKGKFYPDNYLRLYDLIKMTVDLYRDKVGYALTGDGGLVQEGYFAGTASLPSRYLATASRLGLLSHLSGSFYDMDDFQRFVSSQDITQIMSNVSYQFSGMMQVLPLDQQARVTRGDAVRYLVISFDLGSSSNSSGSHTPFLDIYGHSFASQITLLAQLGVVSTGTQYFYPDNYLHRYDFVIMLVNASLVAQNSSLGAQYLLSGYASPYVDVLVHSSYAPFAYYAHDQGWLAYLTVEKRGQEYLLPDTLISVQEIYTVLSRVTGKRFTYDVSTADATYMTRAQFSALLCDVFGFTAQQMSPSLSGSLQSQASGLVGQLATLLQIKDLVAKL